MPDERQMTVKEFCRRYGVGPTTTYKLLGEGAIAAVRYGHRTLIDVESAEAWRRSLPEYKSATLSHKISIKSDVACGERGRNGAKRTRDQAVDA